MKEKQRMANTREEMEQMVQEGLKRLNLVRAQESFYMPRDWWDGGNQEQVIEIPIERPGDHVG